MTANNDTPCMTRNFIQWCMFLCYWRHYLLSQEFVLYLEHEALKYLNSQKRLNARYNKWVEFLHDCTFVFGHKAGVENKVTDALSWHVMILVAMSAEVT